MVDADRAVEGTVYGIAAQQGRTLGQVILAVFAHHDGTKTASGVHGLMVNKDACQ